MRQTLAATGRVLLAASHELRLPHLWLPAAVLLLPTLALQLAFPGYLRTRLAPSVWTVVVGSLLITWVTQVAAAASWGWVDARRRQRPVRTGPLAGAAVRTGTMTMVGLLAGVLPGLWLQGRRAHVPLQRATGDAGGLDASHTQGPLVALAAVTLLVSLLGQSLAAALAEALGTITPASVVDGRTQFTLHYAPHLLTSLLAYAWTTMALTLQAVGVSIASRHDQAVALTRPVHRAARVPMRAALIGMTVVLVVGAVAAVQKIQQHLH